MFSGREFACNGPDQLRSGASLRAGDWVRVRSQTEIIATLDSEGKLDGLPFMPEMIRFCGKKFLVAKRAEKTCVAGMQRRMGNAVHLADLRCDGSAHDGCQSACLLFWREEWLEPGSDPPDARPSLKSSSVGTETNAEHSLQTRTAAQDSGMTYVCQATELGKASKEELKLWNLDQYYREIRAGNVGWAEVRHLLCWFWAWFQWQIFRLLPRKQITSVSRKQKILRGDFVEIRPKTEIWHSLTRDGKHRGLAFSAEMLTFSGKRYRVLDKVERLIDEKTGRMKILKNDCLILDSVICKGHCTLCPRAEFLFWRDDWLRRVQ